MPIAKLLVSRFCRAFLISKPLENSSKGTTPLLPQQAAGVGGQVTREMFWHSRFNQPTQQIASRHLPTDPPLLSVCSSGSAAGAAGCDRQLCWHARTDLGKVELPSLRCLIFCWCYCWKIKGRDAMLFKLRSWGSQWTVAAVPRRRERMWEWWWWLERLLASVCRWEWWSLGLKFVKAFPRFIYCKFILWSSQLLISRLYPFVWLYQDFPSKSTPQVGSNSWTLKIAVLDPSLNLRLGIFLWISCLGGQRKPSWKFWGILQAIGFLQFLHFYGAAKVVVFVSPFGMYVNISIYKIIYVFLLLGSYSWHLAPMLRVEDRTQAGSTHTVLWPHSYKLDIMYLEKINKGCWLQVASG